MWTSRVLATLLAVACLATTAPAGADTRPAVADTFVSSKNDDTNYRNQTTAEVGREMAGFSTNVLRGLLQFDLTGFPAAADIQHVELRLFINSTSADPLGLAIVLNLLASPFDENTVTWNTQPSTLPVPTTNGTMNTPPGTWFAIDVTDLVRAARAGSLPNSLLLRIAAVDEMTNDNQNFTFLTREDGLVTAPQLVIAGVAPVPVLPGPMIALAVLALFAIAITAFRRRALATRRRA
jgi:hypothetical protein